MTAKTGPAPVAKCTLHRDHRMDFASGRVACGRCSEVVGIRCPTCDGHGNACCGWWGWVKYPADAPPPPGVRPANRAPAGRQGRTPRVERTGELLARCWCGATDVLVPVDMVRRGKTLSCGRATCEKLRYLSDSTGPAPVANRGAR